MKDCLTSVAVSAAFAFFAPGALAQVPKEQLLVPPATADRFIIVSPAGQHGTSASWRAADSSVVSRDSMLLRGMLWEQDQTIHFGRNGQPDRIEVRGVTPQGDAAETFTLVDGNAKWKSPIDSGGAGYDGRSHYVPYGGTWSGFAPFVEALYRAPAQSLTLLPGGKARLSKLATATVGKGASRKTLTAYTIEGLSLSPTPIWMDGGKFFGIVLGLGLLPEAYADAFLPLQKAQDEALAKRGPEMVRRFGRVAPKPVAFTHVKLFDAEGGRFLDDQTVVADKGRIVAVGGTGSVTIPANARVIDGTGKSLVPGLWDAHMHVGDDAQGLMLLSMGVTSARNPGAVVEPTIARNARIAKGELLFPTVYSSVLIDGKGPLQAQVAVSVTSADEAVAAVSKAKENGFTGVKFYTSMKPEWLRPAIAKAKRLGLHVHGHVPATMRPRDAIAAGYDEITHMNFVMMQAMPDEVVNQSNGIMRFEGPGRYAKDVDISAEPLKSLVTEMATKRITVDPTLVAFESIYVPENGDLSPAYAPFAGTMPPTTERGFRAGGFKLPEGVTRADYRASFAKMMALASALHKAGIPIVAGTDGSGLEIIRELELYVQAGLTPAEALQTATIVPGRLVKADSVTGSITVGKQADLVLVDGDPSQRISDLRRTVWVMSDGKLMNADELRQAAGFSRPSK
jgi:imidazolonepropionase-like amidohydrolase